MIDRPPNCLTRKVDSLLVILAIGFFTSLYVTNKLVYAAEASPTTQRAGPQKSRRLSVSAKIAYTSEEKYCEIQVYNMSMNAVRISRWPKAVKITFSKPRTTLRALGNGHFVSTFVPGGYTLSFRDKGNLTLYPNEGYIKRIVLNPLETGEYVLQIESPDDWEQESAPSMAFEVEPKSNEPLVIK